MSPDNCPVCGRHIFDLDMTGVETPEGQRWCLTHLPDQHPMAYLKEGRQN